MYVGERVKRRTGKKSKMLRKESMRQVKSKLQTLQTKTFIKVWTVLTITSVDMFALLVK